MSKPQSFTKPEIMSPAGYWPQLRAAVEAGADAVYFGLKHFSARAKVGFGLEELPEVIQTLHSRGVCGYVTVNTLVFDHELREAARTLAAIAAAGADSIIVQDVAVAGLAREIAPDLEVHGSTQMSITSVEGVELAQLFGVTRVVLARELSLDEVRAIRRRTDCELEMFVHGALCVSYSGQCFSSEAWGGRSANRGQCAQACRLPYELMVDGRRQPLDDKRYLLSPGDLYALRQMPDIIQIGVSALKIEGRYKDANYVALTTAAYRQAVDEAWSGTALTIPEHDELQLAQAYSRGFGPHFVSGTNHQTVVDGRAPRHRGVLAGHVLDLLPDSIVIAPHENHDIAPLKAGDGIVFDAADWRSPEEPEEGGYIYAVTALTHGTLKLEFGNRALDPARIRPGDLVWRTHDHDVEKTARRFTQAAAPVHKQGVHVCVTAHEGEPLMTVWTLVSDADQVVTIVADAPLTSAHNHTLDTGYLFKQLGRLGNTPYMLEQVELEVRGAPFAPASLLNQLRRAAAAQLATQQNRPVARTVRDPDRALDVALEVTTHAVRRRSPAKAHMHLLVRTPEQLEAAISIRPASITLDYLDLYGLRNSVEQVKAADLCVRVASPRVLKPQEERIVNFLLRLGCPILVRSGGLLRAILSAGENAELPPLIGDFSLNAANVLAASSYLQLGLDRITPTHDLNAAQITGLAKVVGPERIEVIGYQHLPVFHTEHCVFCRFLSTGTSYKDCGHPCETHRVTLRDNSGRTHPVLADVGCRNTVFGAEAQEASRRLDGWLAAGLRHIRLEFVHESPSEVAAVGAAFAEYLDGDILASDLTQRLSKAVSQGMTEGSLFVPADYLHIPLLG